MIPDLSKHSTQHRQDQLVRQTSRPKVITYSPLVASSSCLQSTTRRVSPILFSHSQSASTLLRAKVAEMGKRDPELASNLSVKLVTYRGSPGEIEELKKLGIKHQELPPFPKLLGGMLAAEHLILGIGKIAVKKVIQLCVDGNRNAVEEQLKSKSVAAKIQLPSGEWEEGKHQGVREMKGGEKEYPWSVPHFYAVATGPGVFYSERTRYEGGFWDNLFNDNTGQAKFFINKEERYTGCFAKGKMDGPGSLEKYDQAKGDFYLYYKGTWKEDLPFTGTFFSPDGKELSWMQNGKAQTTPPQSSSPKTTASPRMSAAALTPLTRTSGSPATRPLTLSLPQTDNDGAEFVIESPIYERYPNPDQNPLINAQLENPSRYLSVEDSVALLTQCIQYGRLQAEKAKNKDLLLFIGNTGAGKSTTANYLAGCTMESQMFEGSIAKVMVVVPKERGGTMDEVMPIGHTKVSKTFMPHIETPPGPGQMTYCDCPGFLDNRGAEINIANAVNIRAAIKQAASIRVLILINYFTLLADRARGLKDVLKICANLFGKSENLVANKSSLLIGVTNTPLELTLPALKKWCSEDSVPFMAELTDRLFFFDPLDRGTDGTGRWNREKCLQEIKSLTPVPSHGKIFSTVLTDADENALVRLSEEIGNNIEKALKVKNFAEASTQLQSLEALSVIEHATLERLIRAQIKRIETHLTKYANQFKTHCSMDRFPEAKVLWSELQSILSYFPQLKSFLEDEQLQDYYNSCLDKHERTKKREAAFEKLLKDAEARSERSEAHIQEVLIQLDEQKKEALSRHAEQEKYYQGHIRQLQEQIENITRSYESAKQELENERKEREAKIIAKIEELTSAGQVQEAASLAHIRDKLSIEYDEKMQRANGEYDQQLKEQEAIKKEIELDKQQQKERLEQELKRIEEQKAEQEKERIAAQERERERVRESARKDALQLLVQGTSLEKEGKHDEALVILNRCLSTLKYAAPESLEEATCTFHLGQAHFQLKNFSAALEHLESAIQIQEILIPGSPELAASYEAKSRVYQEQNKINLALDQFNKFLGILELTSSDRLVVAQGHDRVGEMYHLLGNDQESLSHYQKSLQIRSAVVPESKVVAASHSLIGSIYYALKNYPLSLESYKKCLAIEKQMQENSLEVAAACYQLGRILQIQHREDEALEMIRKSCDIRECHPPSSDLAASYHLAAALLHSQGKMAEALKFYQKCLALEEQSSPNTLALAMSYNNIGRVYASLKEYDEAIRYYEMSMELKKRLDPGGLGMATTHHNMGLVYLATVQYAKALSSFKQAIFIQKTLGPKSLELATYYQSLASLYSAMKQEEESSKCVLQSLDLYQQLAPDSLDLASSHEAAGQVFSSLRKYELALKHQEICLKLRETLSPDSLPLANSYYAVGALTKILAQGDALGGKEKLESAFQLYRKCMEIREKLAPKSADLAFLYERMGDLCMNQKNIPTAKEYYRKSFAIKYPNSQEADQASIAALPSIIQKCRDYTSDGAEKVFAVSELTFLLERRNENTISSKVVQTYIQQELDKKDNAIFEASVFRKSTVLKLFEEALGCFKDS